MITDADILTGEYVAAAAAAESLRVAGECPHASTVGVGRLVTLPAAVGLLPGQVRCTDRCGRVFDSEAEWEEAYLDAFHDTY